MVEVSIKGRTAVFEVLGLHKLWALKSRIRVPLAHIRDVRVGPGTLGWSALRLPGTYVPGLITAGTYYDQGRRVFWDVVRPDRAVTVDLAGGPYNQLVVEVGDPVAVVERLRAACRSSAA